MLQSGIFRISFVNSLFAGILLLFTGKNINGSRGKYG